MAIITLIAVSVISGGSMSYSFAETATGEELKKNPIAAKILENIKKIKQKSEQEKLTKANKVKAEELKQIELRKLEVNTKPYTPTESFKRFVSKINSTDSTKKVFWDQFNFMMQKSDEGKAAKSTILKNGGSKHDAIKAFSEKAQIKRLKMISFNQEANINAGISDAEIQKTFDKYGKLPRYD